ncbi:MAG: hypothetical protein PUD33_01025 [Treponema sp.]|nr:hypothetical protein [Spirochaetia bacterium]MCI7108917.1 hypothetical protein [Spirochaetia bacterium]MDD5776193.1 hypothetical protein [Treponema sp.]MDY4152164.1 hypothetical protein [Treponema sp.]
MKKLLLIFTSCIILGMFFASCKTTRETVPAQSAVIEGEVIQSENPGLEK